MKMPVSPAGSEVDLCLENMAKAINLALQTDFLETELDRVYAAARVKRGAVQVLHKDYIGLGDGLFAKFGRAAKSLQLTFGDPTQRHPKARRIRPKGFAAERSLAWSI